MAIADTLGVAWAVVHFVGVPALAGEWNKNVGCDKIALGDAGPPHGSVGRRSLRDLVPPYSLQRAEK